MERILVVKLADLGDVLTATPALRALRETFLSAHISAAVTPLGAEVLSRSPLVDELIPFEKSSYDRPAGALGLASLAQALGFARRLRRRYDALFLFHHLSTQWGLMKYSSLALSTWAPLRAGLDNGRGWFLTHRARDRGFGAVHEVQYWLEVAQAAGARSDDQRMEFTPDPQAEERVANLLGKAEGAPWVAVHPGSGGYSVARRWFLPCFAQAMEGLVRSFGARLVVVGGREERDLALALARLATVPFVDLVGQTTVAELAAVLVRCRLFVGNDGGVMHLAAAVGTPVVAVFGPSNHRAWGPWGGADSAPHRVLRADLPCSPCLYVGRGVGNRFGCDALTCHRLVAPEQVLLAAEEVLALASAR